MRIQRQSNPDRPQDGPRRSVPAPASVAVQRVLSSGGQVTPRQTLALQRMAGNTAVVQRLANGNDQEQHQHSGQCGHTPAVQRSTVPDVVNSPGQPFDGPLRTEMESRFGADLSHLRVHTDAAAQRSATEIQAEAYTSGNHMVFTPSGIRKPMVVAHEIAHTFDQARGAVPGTDQGNGLKLSSPDDSGERSAEAKAREVMGRPLAPQAAAPASEQPTSHGQTAVQRAATVPGTSGGGAARGTGEAMSIQRAPSQYGDAMDLDDDYRGRSPRHPVMEISPGSHRRSTSSRPGRSPSVGPRRPAHAYDYQDDAMDLDDDPRGRSARHPVMEIGPGSHRSTSSRPRRSSSVGPRASAYSYDYQDDPMDHDGIPIVEPRSGRSAGPRRPGEPRLGVGPRLGPRDPHGRPTSNWAAVPPSARDQLLAIGQRVISEVKRSIKHGAANQMASVGAAGGQLHHMLDATRNPVHRQPVNDPRERLGQDAAAAEAVGVGNCGEHAATAFCLLNKERLPAGVSIWFVSHPAPVDHAFVAVGRPNNPGDIVIIDAWQGTKPVLARDFGHFPFLNRRTGKLTKNAHEFKPNGKDYLRIGRQTVDVGALHDTMDMTAPAVDPNSFRGVPGMYHMRMPDPPAYEREPRPVMVRRPTGGPPPRLHESREPARDRLRRREPSASMRRGLSDWFDGRN